MEGLHRDILWCIFERLPLIDRVIVQRVCKRFYQLGRHPRLFEQTYGMSQEELSTFKCFFRSKKSGHSVNLRSIVLYTLTPFQVHEARRTIRKTGDWKCVFGNLLQFSAVEFCLLISAGFVSKSQRHLCRELTTEKLSWAVSEAGLRLLYRRLITIEHIQQLPAHVLKHITPLFFANGCTGDMLCQLHEKTGHAEAFFDYSPTVDQVRHYLRVGHKIPVRAGPWMTLSDDIITRLREDDVSAVSILNIDQLAFYVSDTGRSLVHEGYLNRNIIASFKKRELELFSCDDVLVVLRSGTCTPDELRLYTLEELMVVAQTVRESEADTWQSDILSYYNKKCKK